MHGKRNGQTNGQTQKWADDYQIDMITKEIDENQMDAYINVVDNQIKFFFDRLVMVLIQKRS